MSRDGLSGIFREAGGETKSKMSKETGLVGPEGISGKGITRLMHLFFRLSTNWPIALCDLWVPSLVLGLR